MFGWLLAHNSPCKIALSILSLHAGNGGQAISQDTGSSADRAFAAAWARVHGNNANDPAAPSSLATAWQAQHDSSVAAQQVHSEAATKSPAGPEEVLQPRATAAEQRIKTAQLPVDAQPSMAVAQSPLPANRETPQHLSHMVETNAVGEAAALSENQMYDAGDHAETERPPASASPRSAAALQHQGISPAALLSPAQQGQRRPGQPAVTSLAPGDKAGSPAVYTRVVRPHTTVKAALADRAVGPRLASPAAAASMQQASADRESLELETRAMHLAMQVHASLHHFPVSHSHCKAVVTVALHECAAHHSKLGLWMLTPHKIHLRPKLCSCGDYA